MALRNFTRSRYSRRKGTFDPLLSLSESITVLPPNITLNIETTQITIDTGSSETETPQIDQKSTENLPITIDPHLVCGERNDGNHPWIVVLEHSDPTGKTERKSLSKGVLIGVRHVLTTVSSLHNSKPFWVVYVIFSRISNISV